MVEEQPQQAFRLRRGVRACADTRDMDTNCRLFVNAHLLVAACRFPAPTHPSPPRPATSGVPPATMLLSRPASSAECLLLGSVRFCPCSGFCPSVLFVRSPRGVGVGCCIFFSNHRPFRSAARYL